MAVFNDLASSASLMAAGKFVDVVGALDGNAQEQSDAEQAYTQALLQGNETWIFLPPNQWPESWKFNNLVCKLRLALYGHPCLGPFGRSTATSDCAKLASNACQNGSRATCTGS